MSIYHDNIEVATRENSYYRNVAYTDKNIQLVYMKLSPLQDIGLESHQETTQFFRIEKGYGKAIVDGKLYILSDGVSIIIPPGSMHNIINLSKFEDMHLYTIYSKPNHPPNTKQFNKPADD